MKVKNIFKLLSCILLGVMMLQITPCAFAHTTTQEGILAQTYYKNKDRYFFGGDDVGWSIDELYHTNGKNITYSFASDLNSTYKNYAIDGAAKWSDIVTITNKPDGLGAGTICMINDIKEEYVARTDSYVTDKKGHLTSWKITINQAYSNQVSDVVLAHEFGHVIGLKDLYAAKSINKLMYYNTGTTTTVPTSYDKWGAKMITGQHTQHTWAYKYYSTNGRTTSHVECCIYCNGYRVSSSNKTTPKTASCNYTYKYYSTSGQGMNSHLRTCETCNYSDIVGCNYNSKNICEYCGMPKNTSLNSINPEPE